MISGFLFSGLKLIFWGGVRMPIRSQASWMDRRSAQERPSFNDEVLCEGAWFCPDGLGLDWDVVGCLLPEVFEGVA